MRLTQTVKKFGSFETVNKQIRFATAVALTKTAQAGQKAVLNALDDNFTLRTNWAQPSNKIGIRITPAKKDRLSAEVKTLAEFLKPHEEGREKLPFGKYIAVPTDNVKRTKKDIIRKAQRPRNLKNAFIIVTRKKKIPILFQRRGKGKKSELFAMYKLIPKAHIKKVQIWKEPIEKSVAANFPQFWGAAVKEAFATAK